MYELGKKSEIPGADNLIPLKISGRPTAMPVLKEGEKVICGYDQRLGERLIICENLTEMQQLDDAYASGMASRICWYKGDDPGFIIAV